MKRLNRAALELVFIPVLLSAMGGTVFAYLGMEKYHQLLHPSFTPPEFLFPLAWGILYLLMIVSSYRIARKETDPGLCSGSIFLFSLQLVVNALWPLFFFTLGWHWLAFVWLLLLIALVLFMILMFQRADLPAALLQLPYLIWLVFAGILNFSIALLN